MARRAWGVLMALLSLCLCVAARAQAPVGGIRGDVLDGDFNVPLRNVRVTVLGAGATGVTDDRGAFIFDALPPGSYDLAVSKEGYDRKIINDVLVTAGSFAEVSASLVGEVFEEDEMIVTGELIANTEQALQLERQESEGIFDSISAQTFSQAGASTAAAALKRVVGTSLVDDKYVVVRGLSDRYVGTVLNGGHIPSADPDKRAVNVDIFPTKLLDSIAVSKTFSPDLPGDFTGGGVDIRTKSFVDKFIFEFSLGTEYNENSSLRDDFLSYSGGGTPWFGFDDGGRSRPVEGDDAPTSSGLIGGFIPTKDLEKLDDITKAFTSTLATRRTTSPLDQNYSFTIGDRAQFLGSEISYLAGGTYKHEFRLIRDGEEGRWEAVGTGQPLVPAGSGDGLDKRTIYKFDRGVDDVLLGGLFAIGLKPSEDHLISTTVLFNQSARDTAQFNRSIESYADETLQKEGIRYVERRLLVVQAQGEHGFDDPGLKVEWMGSWATATQNEPDQRLAVTRYNSASAEYLPTESVPTFKRQWRRFDEENFHFQFDMTKHITLIPEQDSFVRAGVYYDWSERNFKQFKYQYAPGGAAPGSFSSSGEPRWTEEFLSDSNIGGDFSQNLAKWVIVQSRDPFAEYDGRQLILATYGMAEIKLSPRFRLMFGARIESTDLRAVSGAPDEFFGPGALFEKEGVISETDVLPAISMTWEVLKNMNLRLSLAQTVARPSFKEIAPVAEEDFIEGGDVFLGNQNLEMSHINNYDFRWEWFPRGGDVYAVSLFYKEIQDPIEATTFTLGESTFVQYRNFPLGEVYGIELEFRKSFSDLRGTFGGWGLLKHIEFAFNCGYLVSVVKNPRDQEQIDFGVFKPERPLQGQPNFTANASLAYDNRDTGLFAGLFFNVTGPYLYRVGQGGTPNVYELPTPNLDLTVTKKFGGHWSITFRAKNLLDPEFIRAYQYEGREYVYSSFTKGRSYSVGLTYSF
jgi:hypothetical protein